MSGSAVIYDTTPFPFNHPARYARITAIVMDTTNKLLVCKSELEDRLILDFGGLLIHVLASGGCEVWGALWLGKFVHDHDLEDFLSENQG